MAFGGEDPRRTEPREDGMAACECREIHERRRVVLTGGPGAGKTALLELIRQWMYRSW